MGGINYGCTLNFEFRCESLALSSSGAGAAQMENYEVQCTTHRMGGAGPDASSSVTHCRCGNGWARERRAPCS